MKRKRQKPATNNEAFKARMGNAVYEETTDTKQASWPTKIKRKGKAKS